MNNKLPIIESDRLILREFNDSDSHYMFINWANDSENSKYTNMKVASSENICEMTINRWSNYYDKGLFMWAICLKVSDEPIGIISFELTNSPEISLMVGKRHSNSGYATEALSLVIQYGIANLGIKSFWGYHYNENISAGRVMQKAGMTYIRSDVKHNNFFNKNMPISVYEYHTE
jgi:ribosomal-protein-alanine N-acetyltransferase